MIRNRRLAGDRLAISVDRNKARRPLQALLGLIGVQLMTAASVVALTNEDAREAKVAAEQVATTETTAVSSTTSTTRPTHVGTMPPTHAEFREVSPVQETIEQKLQASGAQIVEAEAANDPNQITATVDGQCALQYRLVPTIGGLLVFSEAVGPITDLIDPFLLDQNGSEYSQVFHPEGQYEIGHEFPIDASSTASLDASLDTVTEFLVSTVPMFCAKLPTLHIPSAIE